MNYFPMMKKNYLTPIKNYLFKIKNYSKHILTVYANAEIQKYFRLKSPQWLHQPFNYIPNESLFIFLFILYFCIFYLYNLYSAISVYILLHTLKYNISYRIKCKQKQHSNNATHNEFACSDCYKEHSKYPL